MKFLIFFLFFGTSYGCEIHTKFDKVSYSRPLILKKEAENGFYYPSPTTSIIKFAEQEVFRIACPGSAVQDDSNTFEDNVLAECTNKGDFLLHDGSGVSLDVAKMRCQRAPEPTIEITEIKCSESGVLGIVGFRVETSSSSTENYILYRFCINKEFNQTEWAHSTIIANTALQPAAFKMSITFRNADLYNLQMGEIYKITNQRTRIGTVLDSSLLAKQLIQGGHLYLAKGHLVARADFILPQQKYATYSYLNVAPMWQKINAGNWLRVENLVRDYASAKNKNLDIFTGGFEVYTAKDIKNLDKDIYLYADESATRLSVPVPRVLFKVVYDAADKAGIVLLTINNPYQGTTVTHMCINICAKIDAYQWISSTAEDHLKAGYTYCCAVDDFKAKFQYFPSFETTSLLNIFQ